MVSDEPWHVSAPHPITQAYTITNPQGRIIAVTVPNLDDAQFICEARMARQPRDRTHEAEQDRRIRELEAENARLRLTIIRADKGDKIMQKNEYQSIDRLAALVRILSDEWEEPTWFIGQLEYPENDDSARRAFRRDIAALRAFGFLIEEKRESNHPSYRLVGHKKWPHAASMERVMMPRIRGDVRMG